MIATFVVYVYIKDL